MIFDNVQITTDKSAEENFKILKSWADTLIDSLVMQDNRIRDMENKIKKLESEGE